MNQQDTLSKDVVLNYLTTLPRDALQDLRDEIDALIAQHKTPPSLMRSFDEYQDARLASEEELAPLTEQLIAPGRQFYLTPGQLRLAEGMAGKLAHKEVTVYNVSTDALEERVLSFSFQCNVPAGARRTGGRVSALHVHNAPKFFDEAHKLDEELAIGIEREVKKKPLKRKHIDLAADLLKDF